MRMDVFQPPDMKTVAGTSHQTATVSGEKQGDEEATSNGRCFLVPSSPFVSTQRRPPDRFPLNRLRLECGQTALLVSGSSRTGHGLRSVIWERQEQEDENYQTAINQYHRRRSPPLRQRSLDMRHTSPGEKRKEDLPVAEMVQPRRQSDGEACVSK